MSKFPTKIKTKMRPIIRLLGGYRGYRQAVGHRAWLQAYLKARLQYIPNELQQVSTNKQRHTIFMGALNKKSINSGEIRFVKPICY